MLRAAITTYVSWYLWIWVKWSEVAQSCLTLCDPMDYVAHQAPPFLGISRQEYWSGSPFPSPGDLPDPGIKHMSPALQADALTSEPPGKPYEYGWKWKLSRSVVSDSATPWTVAHQAPPSMGISRQEYWSGLPFPSPGDLPDPGIEPRSPALQADTLTSEPPLCNPKDYSPWDSPGKNTGVGSLSLLQEIFPTQGSNLGLSHCRRTLYNWAKGEALIIIHIYLYI